MKQGLIAMLIELSNARRYNRVIEDMAQYRAAYQLKGDDLYLYERYRFQLSTGASGALSFLVDYVIPYYVASPLQNLSRSIVYILTRAAPNGNFEGGQPTR
jgi:hypothetical protein